MDTERSPSAETVDQAKQRIEQLVREVAELAREETEEGPFFSELLGRTVSAMAAVGGAVWLEDERGGMRLAGRVNLSEAALKDPGDDHSQHHRLVAEVLDRGQPAMVPPFSEATDRQSGNPTSYLLLLAPLAAGGRSRGVIEVFQRPVGDREVQQGFLRFVRKMAELGGTWLDQRGGAPRGGSDADSAALWRQSDAFSRTVHESLDVRETAYTVANEGRRLIGCDRVSVAMCRGGRCRVEAVSGQDLFDKRSNIVRLAGRLATRVVAAGEPLWFSGDPQDLPPQLEQALTEYVDESLTKSIAVIPLAGPPKRARSRREEEDAAEREPLRPPLGALIVEQIEDARPWPALAQRIEVVTEHSSRALARAVEHSSLFLMPVWRTLGKARHLVHPHVLPKTLVVTAAILAVLCALVFIPVDFTLTAEGVLQPKDRREVFAEVAGVVAAVYVEHGASVEKGAPLVELRNVELQMRKSEVEGDLQAVRDQLASMRRTLLDGGPLSQAERTRTAAEIGRLEKQRANLQQQLRLIDEQIGALTVTAPISGTVITWHVEELLADRPVQVGEVLMTVANPDAEWELEVYMPESRMGHVARSAAEAESPLPVRYAVASQPGKTHEGTVRDFHTVAEMHEERGQSVRIRVDVDEADLVDPRPGTTAKARVRCGRACIAYAYGHEVLEFVQRHILF